MFGEYEERKGEIEVPENGRESACRRCNAPIIWAITAAGKQIPLSKRTIQHRPDGIPFALAHFADCPNANDFRKRS
mgnify:CR=1 FL=1